MNKNAKIMVYIGMSAMLVYLIFFAIMFSLAINNDKSTTALEFIFTIAPLISVMALDCDLNDAFALISTLVPSIFVVIPLALSA